MTDAANQPLHYAVLVTAEVHGTWRTIYANGDLAKAREAAADFARANPDQQAVIMQYVDHAFFDPRVVFAKDGRL